MYFNLSVCSLILNTQFALCYIFLSFLYFILVLGFMRANPAFILDIVKTLADTF